MKQHKENSAPDKGAVTRLRLLEEAERLFAEKGIEGASLREITGAAGANLASVSYYFGSKEGLLREVLRTRFEPVNARRLELLDALEARQVGLSLEEVLDAFLRPAFECFEGSGRHFVLLMARIHHSPHAAATEFLAEELGPMAERFIATLARILPEVSPDRLFVRVHFLVGAMVHCLTESDPEQCIAGITTNALDTEGLLTELVQFCAAGFSRPSPGVKG